MARGLPLLVIRPEPGCSVTVAAALACGLDAHACPLFAVSPVAWAPPPAADFDILLAGSANVFRHGGTGLDRLRDLSVHAVGATTAAAAAAAGFTVSHVGEGGLQAVLDDIPAGGRVLRLAGAERIALRVPAGATMSERVVYATSPLPLPAQMVAKLTQPAVVAIHSAAASRHFAKACDQAGLSRGHLALATIGPRVTAAAGAGWRVIATADRPTDAALLAKARELCQTAR